ncbi:MAG: LysM peptidoglycan-binding domain-containing protein [Verrucomicrobiota bacterium]|nr:LysM peptidoglycan-binding domain-containing protein [Opitutales bacterium]
MLTRLFFAGALLGATAAPGQTTSPQVELANLREDLRGLVQRVGELSLRVEQLERQNAELRDKVSADSPAYATLSQLHDAITELKRAINAGDAVTAERATAQIKRLGEATNAAMDSLARGLATRPTVPASFTDNYAKEGVSYTVQKGDTLAVIAKKTGGRSQDIINANKLTDPSRIQAGQTLFIPTPEAK